MENKQTTEIGDMITDWRDLVALPVGSVVLARHKTHGDSWPWVKTDDTDLMDENGDRRSTAWACVAYTADRPDAELLIQSSAVLVLWRGDVAFPPASEGGQSDA